MYCFKCHAVIYILFNKNYLVCLNLFVGNWFRSDAMLTKVWINVFVGDSITTGDRIFPFFFRQFTTRYQAENNCCALNAKRKGARLNPYLRINGRICWRHIFISFAHFCRFHSCLGFAGKHFRKWGFSSFTQKVREWDKGMQFWKILFEIFHIWSLMYTLLITPGLWIADEMIPRSFLSKYVNRYYGRAHEVL